MNRLELRLRQLKGREEKGLIGFMMACEPDFTTAVECAKALEEAGCDILEIGVPYADPIADGEVIERAHFRGVERGMNMTKALEFVRAVHDNCSLPLVMFSYFNPILRRGVEVFARELETAGASAVIIPDLPLEEREKYDQIDVDIIPMLAPTADEQRMARADHYARSFIYCVSVAGVTGERDRLPDLTDYLSRVRARTSHPLAVGFGISSGAQVARIKDYADLVVVGSALVRIIEENSDDKTRLLSELSALARNLKQALR